MDTRTIDHSGNLIIRKYSDSKPITVRAGKDETIYNNHFANEVKAAAQYINNCNPNVLHRSLTAGQINRLVNFIHKFNNEDVFAEKDAQYFLHMVKAMQEAGI